MAIPSVVGVGNAAAGTGDVVPTRHASTAADDVHFMIVSQSAVNDFGAFTPSGWTLVVQTEVGSNAATDACASLYWRRAVGGDSDPTVPDTGNHTHARIITVRGCPTSGNPWSLTPVASTDATANTSVSIAGQTTGHNDCLILYFVSTGVDQDSTTEVSSWANSNLANVTERMDNWNSAGNGSGFSCMTGELATAGATGTATATLVNSANKVYFVVCLKPAANAYTLTAAQGSYTLTGQTALLKRGYPMTAAQGSYTLTGQTALLKRGYPMVAGQGSFTLTGQSVNFPRTYILPAAQGSYTLTGNAASLERGLFILAGPGSYTLTGQDVTLTYGGLNHYTITAAQGSYALSGQAVGLFYSRKLGAAQGSFALSGQTASLYHGHLLTSSFGAFTLTGNAANLLYGRKLTSTQGSFALTGQAANLLYGRRLVAGVGLFALTGNASNLLHAWLLLAVRGAYAITGIDTGLSIGAAVSVPGSAFTEEIQIYAALLEEIPAGSFLELSVINDALTEEQPMLAQLEESQIYTAQLAEER